MSKGRFEKVESGHPSRLHRQPFPEIASVRTEKRSFTANIMTDKEAYSVLLLHPLVIIKKLHVVLFPALMPSIVQVKKTASLQSFLFMQLLFVLIDGDKTGTVKVLHLVFLSYLPFIAVAITH